MTIKQIKTYLLSVLFVASTAVGVVATGAVGSTDVSAYTCPAGQEFHDSDNACWTKETKSPTAGRGGTLSCGTNFNLVGGQCVKYTRSNTAPTADDGKPLSLSCPNGLVYHTSDNKCWKEEQGTVETTAGGGRKCSNGAEYNAYDDPKCVKYTEMEDKPIIGEAKPPTEDQKKAARDKMVADCKASGKSDAECNKLVSEAEKECANSANFEECMKNKSAVANGECEDGGKVDPKTGKCPNGDDPKLAGTDNTGKNCGQAETVLITCSGSGVGAIGDVLRIVITVLSVLIGVAAVGGLAWASVGYAKAQDSEGDTKEAKELIRNIVIGLLLYGFMVAIINWLVPGGVIG